MRLTQGRNADEPETELWSGCYSPKAMIGVWVGVGIATVVLLIIGFLNPLQANDGLLWSAILIVIALGWLIPFGQLMYRRMSMKYRLTSQRFFHQRGILRIVTDRIELIDVDDVKTRQGFIERMVGVGTLDISSTDRSHPQLSLPGIEEVQKIAHVMDDARRAERRKRAMHIEAV